MCFMVLPTKPFLDHSVVKNAEGRLGVGWEGAQPIGKAPVRAAASTVGHGLANKQQK